MYTGQSLHLLVSLKSKLTEGLNLFEILKWSGG